LKFPKILALKTR